MRWTAIGDGAHDLLLQDSGFVVEENGIAFALALTHLGGAVESRNLDGFVVEVEGLRFLEVVNAVDAVETIAKGARHFEVRHLVLAHRHEVSVVEEDVRRHECRIGEQSRIDVVRVLSHLVLEGGATLKFANVGVHVEEEVEFDDFGNVALHVERDTFGVETRREVVNDDFFNIASDVVRVRVGGEAMIVSNEEIAISVIELLQTYEVLQGTEVVAEMKRSRRSDAGNDFFHFTKITDYFLFSANRNRLKSSKDLERGTLCLVPRMKAASRSGMATSEEVMSSTFSLNLAGCAVSRKTPTSSGRRRSQSAW